MTEPTATDDDPIKMKVEAAVLEAIEELVGDAKAPFRPGQLLDDDLGIDSLEFVRLIQISEEKLDVVLKDKAAAGVKTVGDLVALLDTTCRLEAEATAL
jgi:acyl carrier protein